MLGGFGRQAGAEVGVCATWGALDDWLAGAAVDVHQSTLGHSVEAG